MEVSENKLLVEPISGEEKVIESSYEANVDAPMRGAMLKLSSLPAGVSREMIKEVLLGLSAPVYFVDVYSDNTALIRLCHENGARLLLDKLKNGKIFIGQKSVQVSALEKGEEDEFLPKPKDDIHYFWKSLGTVKAKEKLPSFNSNDLCHRYGPDRRNEATKSTTIRQQKSSVPSGCRPKSNDSTKSSTKGQQISKLPKTFSDWGDERSGRIQLDYQYGAILEPRTPLLSTGLTVRFAYVTSPTHFYVHVKDEVNTLLEPLMKRLNKLYDRSEPVSMELPEIGSFWVAKVKMRNLNWSRVLIYDVGHSKKSISKVTVFSVDWGFLENVELSQLRPLVPEVMETPCLVLYFRLAGIFPLNQSENSENWSKAANNSLIQLATYGEDFLALIHEEDQIVGQYSVLMWKGVEEDGITLNEMLVNLKLASSNVFPVEDYAVADVIEPKEEQHLLNQNLPNANPVAAGYYCFKNTADHTPKDDQAIRCSSPAVEDEAFTRERVVDYCTYLPVIATPTAGSRISIKVSNVSNSFRFYCVLSASAETLLAHQLDIQKEYNENHQLHRVAVNPLAADIVIARSPTNKIWYRARILQELEDDVFAVYFIDFGHEKVVLKSDVCVLLTRFTQLPMQAVEMSLRGIDRKRNSEKARDELMSLVKDKDLVARVVSDNPKLLDDLYDEGKQVDIARELNRRLAFEEAKCRKYDPYHGVKFIPG